MGVVSGSYEGLRYYYAECDDCGVLNYTVGKKAYMKTFQTLGKAENFLILHEAKVHKRASEVVKR